MHELIVALTEMAKAATAYFDSRSSNLKQAMPPLVPAPVEVKEKKVKAAPKPEPVAPAAAPAVNDGLGLDEAPKKELTEKEAIARVDEVTRQYVALCKNDKPEDGRVKAIALMQTTFKVAKLGELDQAGRLAWIAAMEKGIAEHK